jgi:ABC-type sugar transport system permease subunit
MASAADTRPVSRAGPVRAGGPKIVALWFMLPITAAFVLFYVWPALNTFAGSAFEWSVFSPWNIVDLGDSEFVGLSNYLDLLTSERFWNAAVNTLVWIVFFPLLVTGFSLLVAILLWQARRAATLFRSLFVLPMTLSLTAIGVIWKLMYNPDYGTVDALVRLLQLDFAANWGPLEFQTGQWLSSVGFLDLGFQRLSLVNFSLLMPAFWAFTGFGVITFAAGLTTIPEDLIDAASVDGANWRQVMRYVVVPLLRRPIVIVGVVSVIFALRTFDIVWVATQGGPGSDTEVLAVLLYKDAFSFLDVPLAGEASAIAILMSAVMILGAYPYLRTVLRRGPER